MRNLDEWENYLKPYFQGRLRLIGEIPMRRRDMEDIADSLYALIQIENLTRATEIIFQHYLHVLIVFLTAFAAHNLERDYWGRISQRLIGRSVNLLNYNWHHIYLDQVKKYGLRHFTGDESAHKYITTIRFHGGIPAYSLPDFFASIVLPSIQRSIYNGLPAGKVLDLILKNIYNVDAAVINFLGNSGDLGVEFFQSCRDMAARYQKDREVPTPETTDLPAYVVDAFITFMERGQEYGVHLRKPTLLFNPYDQPHLSVHLPEEQIPLRYVEDQLLWQVASQDLPQPLELYPSIHKQRQDVLIRETSLSPDIAPTSFKISLFRRGPTSLEPVRSWTLACLPPADRPLLAFRQAQYSSGYALRMVEIGLNLPALQLLLVVPSDVSIQVDGDAQPREIIAHLGGAWHGWQAQIWDLKNVLALHLLREKKEICPSIPIEIVAQEPEMIGSTCVYNDDPNRIPLYAGHTPILRVPIRPGRPLKDELERWKIELQSAIETFPSLNLETDLSTYINQADSFDETVIELDLKVLLGENAAGTFKLRVTSEGENETEFRFRVWPSLHVIGLPKYIFPRSDSIQLVEFNIRLPEGTLCEIQAGVDGVKIETGVVASKIIVQPDITRADVYIVKPLTDGESVRVPLYIPIPCLRWWLSLGNTEDEIPWTTYPVQKPIDAILQSEVPSLHLQMHGLQGIAGHLRLLLVDPDKPEEVLQEERVRTGPLDKDWLRIPLSPFRTTLRHYENASQLELHLFCWLESGKSVQLPLVLFSRHLDVYDVGLQSVGELTWKLTWGETIPILRNRRVMITSAWQPWQPPLEFEIPDAAQGTYIIQETSLPASHYHIHFRTAPKLAQKQIQFPAGEYFEVITSSPESRLDELEHFSSQNQNQAFLMNFEKACILVELRKPNDVPVNDCIAKIKAGLVTNLTALLKFQEWLSSQPGQYANALAILAWMYRPSLVQRALLLPRQAPERQAYIAHVAGNKILDIESARLFVLYEDDPLVLRHCLKELIKRHTNTGALPIQKVVLLIIEMIQKKRLSYQDAVDLLTLESRSTLQALLESPQTSTRDRLLAIFQQAIEIATNTSS